ncbi:hypothetical protein BACCAP_02132 [Pseudoflavonifractor capillosus ATCC 29799]|uniref:Uncharacterized protein n=1 Tax=Pseudoflavonifractor capillosus ATCC 29799 TaxID=411467 RepID=A6NV97_9FIRM|nr:hypothetical protein BACCAP_02132 [Pseudoflavonifractor capillosus ATCC 29799]
MHGYALYRLQLIIVILLPNVKVIFPLTERYFRHKPDRG